MTNKPKNDGTLLYPGVVLRGGSILLQPEKKDSKKSVGKSAKLNSHANEKPARKRNKTFVNILVED